MHYATRKFESSMNGVQNVAQRPQHLAFRGIEIYGEIGGAGNMSRQQGRNEQAARRIHIVNIRNPSATQFAANSAGRAIPTCIASRPRNNSGFAESAGRARLRSHLERSIISMKSAMKRGRMLRRRCTFS